MSKYDANKILSDFGYDPRVESEIIRRARSLLGSSIQDIVRNSPLTQKKFKKLNKGIIGNLIEEHGFGLPVNNLPEPDFLDTGIELKIVPLELSSKGLSVKERTKVCSIDYFKLIQETWHCSHVKKKLDKVLFIYYEYDGNNILRSRLKHYDLWELKGPISEIIKNDWNIVKGYVRQGRAHDLSESISKVLAASRTGQGKGRDWVRQPKNGVPALKRAFSLKQSFTRQRWIEINNKKKYESIIDTLKIKEVLQFEAKVLERLRRFEGEKLGVLSSKLSVRIPKGKNAAATIIKKALGFKSVQSRIKEFEQFGVTVKSVPVRPSDHRPWEAISFAAFKLMELEKENWDEASIRDDIERILFVPIYENEHPGTKVEDRIVGKVFFWSPSTDELEIIKKEWIKYRNDIKRSKAKVSKIKWGKGFREITSLKKESDTEIIHVRPHAKDKTDRDVDSHGHSVVKQSFWLNKSFIHKLIKKEKE